MGALVLLRAAMQGYHEAGQESTQNGSEVMRPFMECLPFSLDDADDMHLSVQPETTIVTCAHSRLRTLRACSLAANAPSKGRAAKHSKTVRIQLLE